VDARLHGFRPHMHVRGSDVSHAADNISVTMSNGREGEIVEIEPK
jgi:hypothetical protein